MATQVLQCRDCKAEFIFDDKERSFFAEREWAAPIRCHNCRRKHKALMAEKKKVVHNVPRVMPGDALAKLLGGNA